MRFIILCLLIYLAYRAVKTLIAQSKPARTPEAAGGMIPVDDVMVKDPVCETYIPKRDGIRVTVNGETITFCSTACRDKYLDKTGKNPE